MITLILFLLIILLSLIFVYFLPGFYISELILSFNPYIIFFSLLGLGVSIFGFKSKKFGKFVKIMPLFLFLFALIFFLYSKEYNSFYNGQGFKTIQSDNIDEGLDILYSNILYTNDNYTGILNQISEKDPDMIFMVEFTDYHNQALKDILKKDYPYSARTSWSQNYFGNVVFSKYPITNLTHKIDQGKWRYSYFYANYNNKNYYFYLMHFSSPVSKIYFEKRNIQFETLFKDFNEHKQKRTDNDRVIVLGDFNVSPWSKYYNMLEKNLDGLNNITKRSTILFTWRLLYVPFLQSHIDHVFVSDNVKIIDLEKISIPGSDHDGFLLKGIN